MKTLSGAAAVTALLAFNGGFVDAAGFLGLQGLFVAHVTGNFVTLGAALVLGGHGIYGKILALPVFALAVAMARLAGGALRARNAPALRVLLGAEAVLLFVFFALAVTFGPFPIRIRPPPWSPALPASPPWRCRTPCSACISAISRRPRS